MENKELIKKLKKEQDELDKKLTKLQWFIAKETVRENGPIISDLQLNLLIVQRDAMSAYSNVLEMRINDLEEQYD